MTEKVCGLTLHTFFFYKYEFMIVLLHRIIKIPNGKAIIPLFKRINAQEECEIQ